MTNITVSGITERNATVTVNSIVVPFGGLSFSTVVELVEGLNLIAIQSCDKVYNCNEATVNVTRDTKPPLLDVTYPSVNNELLTNKDKVTVLGKTDTGALVFINGEPLTNIMNGVINCTVTLVEGKNTITVRSVDDVGNSKELKLTVMLDTKAPSLIITYPKNVLRTREAQVTIKGETEINSTLDVNGATVPFTGTSFQKPVTLDTEGRNQFKFTARDLAGNSRSVLVTIVRDTLVNLTMVSPSDGTTTKNATIIIKGTTDRDATIKVNNETVMPDANGNYEKEMALVVGENHINIKAVDDLGNEKDSALTVIREKKAQQPKPFLGGLLLPIAIGLGAIIAIGVVIGVIMMRRKKATPPPPPDGTQPQQQQWAQAPPEQGTPPQWPPQQQSPQDAPQSYDGEQPQWPNPPTQ
jgi:hypothetical protein